jgi:hypothetical protein
MWFRFIIFVAVFAGVGCSGSHSSSGGTDPENKQAPMEELDFEEGAVEANARRVHSLVDVGMTIEEASKKLRNHGFQVGNKYKPTESGDYYHVVVGIGKKSFTTWETFKYTVGIPSDEKSAVVLKANLDNVVISVE